MEYGQILVLEFIVIQARIFCNMLFNDTISTKYDI